MGALRNRKEFQRPPWDPGGCADEVQTLTEAQESGHKHRACSQHFEDGANCPHQDLLTLTGSHLFHLSDPAPFKSICGQLFAVVGLVSRTSFLVRQWTELLHNWWEVQEPCWWLQALRVVTQQTVGQCEATPQEPRPASEAPEQVVSPNLKSWQTENGASNIIW